MRADTHSIALIPNIEILALNGHELSGPLPTELGLLTRLGEFDESACNRYIGILFLTVSTLCFPSERLDLYNNYFNGKVPSEIGNLKRLSKQLCWAIPTTKSLP